MAKKQSTKPRPAPKQRPEIPNKESLIEYLNENSETELPFVEEAWIKACEKAEADKTKETPMRTTITKNADGTETVKTQKAGILITDPVKQYFKLMNLPQYKKRGMALQSVKAVEIESQKQIYDTVFDNDAPEVVDEITSWIDLFSPMERQYLRQRYVSYYDQYEINEASDKIGLKGVLSLEIELYRVDIKRAQGKAIDLNDEKKLREMLDNTMQSLKWTRKQRSAREDLAQNKFGIWLDNMIKNGEFTPNPKHYDQDEVDFILDKILENQKKMLS